MKLFKLKRRFKEYKRGSQFYLVSESEFIGVKEYVLRTTDLKERLSISEKELENFSFIKDVMKIDI
ncbi:hypothetical protein JOC85_000886 [Bacillus mesophilus]|uniref:Uncharacterized protein n=1 Tax=Bacillus mesophilus TaxID=1808955 RepID=A0A6M0QBP7_9BACI|nr:hypothetical protein [Bacillus mesophilus]MBM7660119.1 hypothetical protein [Bacillus mesophilus]NEY73772.1 hypothetical protein [Bacillus mesophilus]